MSLPLAIVDTRQEEPPSAVLCGRYFDFRAPPPQWGGLDLDSRSSGCARLGGEVGPPLGVVVEEVAVLVVLVRRFSS